MNTLMQVHNIVCRGSFYSHSKIALGQYRSDFTNSLCVCVSYAGFENVQYV